jgi:hypothetical protein
MRIPPFTTVALATSLVILAGGPARAADLFKIDFENYAAGTLETGQPPQPEIFRWKTLKSPADIVTNIVHAGTHSLRLGPRRASINRRFDGGDGIRPLSSLVQYYDFWIHPACDPSDYIVVARLRDVSGSTFADVHFYNGGPIKVMAGTGDKDKPIVLADSGAAWTPGKWHRLTLRLDVTEQKFQLYVNGERTSEGPWKFPSKFNGNISDVTLEGTDSTLENNWVYYDDLHWTDTDPLAKK